MKGFFKDPANLKYSINTIVPMVVFLTSLLSIVVALNVISKGQSFIAWIWIFGVSIFSSCCAFVVVRAMTKPISDLVKKAEHIVRLEEFKKERGRMIEVYKLIERLMEYARTREDASERRSLIESMEKLDYIIPLGYMSLMVAHEVRNPLNTITGMSELLREKAADDSERRYISEVLNAAKKIDVFTRELLDFTDNELAYEEFNLYDVLRDSVHDVQADFLDVHIEHPEKGELVCLADKTKIYQVIYNVIRNAAKFEQNGGTVRVKLQHGRNKKLAKISVFNGSSYIEKVDYEAIFKPFFTKQKGGKGLGLFISMRNMKLHGGDIKVESEERSGTTFTIELPLLAGRELPNTQ